MFKYRKIEGLKIRINDKYIITAEFYPCKNRDRNGFMYSLWINRIDTDFRDKISDEKFIATSKYEVKADINNVIYTIYKNNYFNKYIERYEQYIRYICDGIDKEEIRNERLFV